MNYRKHYDQLIINAIEKHDQRAPLKHHERHHIVPRCFGGTDEESNIVKLTPREHFIAHLLLLNMSSGVQKSKMAMALLRMSGVQPRHLRNARHYEKARLLHYKYHPAKTDKESFGNSIRDGMRNRLITDGLTEHHCGICMCNKWLCVTNGPYVCASCIKKRRKLTDSVKAFLCSCGCGVNTKNSSDYWILGHLTSCSCGCGEVKIVTGNTRDTKLFIHGHNSHDDLANRNRSKTLKLTLGSLSKEELSARSRKSFQSGDQKQRALNIRRGKASMLEITNAEGVIREILSCDIEHEYGLSWNLIRYKCREGVSCTFDDITVRITKQYGKKK